MAPYVIGAHILPFSKEPDTIVACGIMPDNDDDNAGVLAVGMTLTFKNSTTTASNNLGGSSSSSSSDNNSRNSNNPPSSRSIASGIVGYLAESSEEALWIFSRKFRGNFMCRKERSDQNSRYSSLSNICNSYVQIRW